MTSGAFVPSDVTTLLLAWRQGDAQALNRLIPAVERQLRRLAQRAMAGERAGDTLQPTALVNEVYLRLVDVKQVSWRDRTHFFALAATLMRRILVDRARRRRTAKRGGTIQTVALDEHALEVAGGAQRPDLVALNEALDALRTIDPRRSRVVELKFFGGLTAEEIAEVLQVSRATVLRDWTLARAWLFREMKGRSDTEDAAPA